MDKRMEPKIEDLEIELLLEAIFRQYGYDFRNYSRVHIKRRLLQFSQKHSYASISITQHHLLYDQGLFNQLLKDFSINVTEMFRDPSFYSVIKNEVLPILESYPFIKIWNAGCSSGEEAYSIAIFLYEAGLLDRCQIYATDFNDQVLHRAESGIYKISDIQLFTRNYQKAGGQESFADYYTADQESAVFKSFLRDRIVFANHNLVSDSVFGEMQLILCRNVMIYFDEKLQGHVFGLLDKSLCRGGFLCLGMKESLRFSEIDKYYSEVKPKSRIYKKKIMQETSG